MTTSSFDARVTADHQGKTAAELVGLDVDALKGVSASDRQHLQEAFGVTTIGDLAQNRFIRVAQAIVAHSANIEHDAGPNLEWSTLFKAAPLETYQAHPQSFRLDFGPVYYRGRLDGTARVLIVGQDPAPNELVGHRAFVGTSGQRIQAFLRRLGIRRDYLMVNTFLYPVFGQFIADIRELSGDPKILGFRNRVLDYIAHHNPLEAIIAAGAAAHDAIERWPGHSAYQIQNITHPSARDRAQLLANWNAGLARLRTLVQPEVGVVVDHTTYGADFTDEDYEPIPRYDLPFGVPEWHGVGSHAQRGRLEDGSTDHKEIIWTAP